MAEFLDEVVGKLERAYNPEGHPHPPGTYVSASGIVKYTAEDLAKKMIAKRRGEEDHVPAFWAYKGNALGDRALEPFGWQEIRSTTPIPLGDDIDDEWIIAGHCDGIDIVNSKVVVLEHKAHINADGEKVEAAKRQGMLYLAMMWDTARRAFASGETDVIFNPASWAGDEDPYFRWVEPWVPGGVVVAIARPYPPPIIHPVEVTTDDLEEVLDFYKEKAKYIVKAVVNEDPKIAREWDIKVDEFEYLETIDPSDEQQIQSLYDELGELSEKIDELEDRQKRVKNQIGQIHDKNGLQVIEANGWRSRWIESQGRRRASVKELEEAGLEQYIKPGNPYRYLRVDRVDE